MQNNCCCFFQDFDNLLIKTCELLRKKKNVLNNVKAILVDEVSEILTIFYF